MEHLQDLIDSKKDYQLAINEQKLKEIFSPIILGYYARRTPAITTYEEISAATVLSMNKRYVSGSLRGVDHLRGLDMLRLEDNAITGSINISNLTKLTDVRIGVNELDEIGNISQLTNLQYFSANVNNLESIGSIVSLTELTTFNISGNNIQDVGSVAGMVNMEVFNVAYNNFSTARVDDILSQFNSIVTNQGESRKLTSLILIGQNMGIPTGGDTNPDVVSLRDAGVTVSIRT